MFIGSILSVAEWTELADSFSRNRFIHCDPELKDDDEVHSRGSIVHPELKTLDLLNESPAVCDTDSVEESEYVSSGSRYGKSRSGTLIPPFVSLPPIIITSAQNQQPHQPHQRVSDELSPGEIHT